MSYLKKLTAEEKSKFREFSTWEGYLDGAINDFLISNPEEDLAKAVFKIDHIIFNCNVLFTGEIPFSIRFETCYFLGEINFKTLKFRGDLFFMRCFCDEELYIFPSATFEKEFNLIDLTIRRQVYIKGGIFDICQWRIIERGILKIAGGTFRELNIGYWGGVMLQELSINLTPELNGYIRVTGTDSKIENFSIFKSASEVSISIENIAVNLLSLYGYRNEKNFRITGLKSFEAEKPSEVSIIEAYLGKAEFYNINFKEFQIINISNSHILESSFVNVGWKERITSFKGRGIGLSDSEKLLPDKIKRFESLDHYTIDESLSNDIDVINYYKDNREVYRQLKYVYGKQGDVINEQKFHSKEMRIYNYTINLEDEFWTKTIIKLSYWFSDFGQSVKRPLLSLLIGHLLLTWLLILTGGINGLEVNFPQPNYKGFETAFHAYFKYINPLRKLDNDFIGYYIVIDLTMRIWASYMIYNIIRGSRRFIK